MTIGRSADALAPGDCEYERMTANPSMSAAVYRRFGSPEVVHLEQVPVPVPSAGEVVIGLLAAAGIGLFRPSRRVLGMDAAGVIAAVAPSVTAFAPGDEVIALPGAAFGGHAEYLRMPADGPIARAPRSLPLEESVALIFGGVTAYSFFKNVAIGDGTTVLVNGASGAVGTAAIQLAKQRGAYVTAVTSAKNTELVTALGADDTIDYIREDFTASGRTWDVIVDAVGNAPFTRVEHAITPGGALLLVINDLPGALRSRGQSRRTGKLVTGDGGNPTARDLAELTALADAGQLRPVIDRTYDLADIVDAHRYVDTGRKVGSVVLRIGAF